MYSSELFLNELTDEQKKKLKRYVKIAGGIAAGAGLAVGAHYLTKGKKLDVSKIPDKEKLVGSAVKEIKQAEKAKKILKTPPKQYSVKDTKKMLKSKKPITI